MVVSRYAASEPSVLSLGGRDLSLTGVPSQGLNVAELLRTLLRRWWVIAITTLLAAFIAYSYIKLTPDSYVASGILAVEPQRFSIPELQGALSGDHSADPLPEVLTEVQVLTSPRLVQQVIDTLHLETNPELDPRVERPSKPRALLSAWGLKGVVDWGHNLTARAITLVAGERSQPELTPELIRQVVLGEVEKNLAVAHDTRSLIIAIQYTAEDPKVAAAVVNTLISAYEQARFDDHERINKAANASLTRRVEDLHQQVVGLEEKIRAARARNDMPELATGNVNEQQLSELISSATKAGVERAQAESIAARAHAMVQSGATDQLAAVVASPTISSLRAQESDASRTIAEMQSRHGDNFPALQAAKANLQAVRTQIAAEIRRTVASLDTQAKTAAQQDQQVQAALKSARATSHQGAGSQLEIKQLEDEVIARRKLYESLRTRAEQTQTDPNQQMVTGARVVSGATAPALPDGPKRKKATAIGAVGGTLMGCFLALVGGRRTRRFQDGDELAPAIGLPVLAKLPDIRRSRPNSSRPNSSRPSSDAAEALRLLRSRIRLLGGTSAARTVAFVTAGGRADSPATALAFARMAAMDGERVLLIEGSITDPQLVNRMGPDLPDAAQNGLDNLFEKTMPLRDATTSDPVSGMDMLLVKAPSPRLLDFLHGTRFQMLLAEAVQSYGLVIISAPSPHRSETIALVHAADVTIFVVGTGRINTATLNSTISGLPKNPYGLAAAVLAA